MGLRSLTVAVWSGACSTEVLRQLTAEPQNNITHVATHAQTDRQTHIGKRRIADV